MHITHAQGHSLPGRRRLAVAGLAAAFCITLALAIGGTAPANAAGPDDIPPGASHSYPTWLFPLSTTVCVTNNTNQPGMADVRPWFSSQHDEILVRRFDRKCIDRPWWGNMIDVFNVSDTELGTDPVLTVETS